MMKKLGFGLMRLPLTDKNKYNSIDYNAAQEMVDLFLSKGFTYFDTAYMYHEDQSEKFVKKAIIERHPRESFTITTKMPCMMVETLDDMKRVFDEQVERTGAIYFDYYWLHALNKNEVAKMDRIGGWNFIKQLKAEGKVRHIGFSFHDDSATLEKIFIEHPELEFVQLQINYIDWDSDTVEAGKCYELSEKYHRPVIVMEPVKGGALAKVPEVVEKKMREMHPDWSPASWAVRWTASLPNVMMVLSGMSNMEQMEDNTSYMADFKPLNEAENEVIKFAAKTIWGTTDIDCTDCHYCTARCPQNIAIPDYFALINQLKRFGNFETRHCQMQYNELIKRHAKASACIGCGNCEIACPQHLPIIDNLQRVVKLFEGK